MEDLIMGLKKPEDPLHDCSRVPEIGESHLGTLLPTGRTTVACPGITATPARALARTRKEQCALSIHKKDNH